MTAIIDQIRDVKIVVLGDFCLDAYWFIDGSKSEVSVETGQPTQPVKEQKYTLGGAGNVANNLATMGVNYVRAFGVIGADPFGSEMVGLMRNTGIETSNLLVQKKNWSTHVYAKPYIADHEKNRFDFGNFNTLLKSTADQLISNLNEEIPKVDLVVINEQVISGIHTPYFRQNLVKLILKYPTKKFIVDSRNYSDCYDGAYRKVNDIEAANLCGMIKDPDDVVLHSEIKLAARTLYEKYDKPLFITRGERGSLIINENGITDVFGLLITSKIDTVGAGDSYLAGAAATLAAGYSMETSAEIGTYVAGVTIQKLFQTGTAAPEEILEIGKDPDFIHEPELAEDIRQAKYIDDSEIECIECNIKWEEELDIHYAIFDHDGTISTLREGWEEIMSPVMLRAILGNHFHDADEAIYHRVQTRVADFIDKTTGIQTLVQMKGLVELVHEFGCVPEKLILDEFGYKSIYNDELIKMVKDREKKITQGELSVEDYTIKNAVIFLNELYKSGVKLYLASGTDESDVKNEARILGYDHLFEGRIYGAVGDINKEAKKIVLDRILDTISDSGKGQIVTFGDGPVEIRETRKRGGIAVGIASNEIKRHSLNEHKRTRLIKAGANIIIPDFSQYQKLLDLLYITGKEHVASKV